MIETIPISDIKIGTRVRPLDNSKVSELADSIIKIGLLNPITLDTRYNLLAGHHRLRALQVLGYSEVEVKVVDLNANKRILASIEENLIRNELNLIEKSEHMVQRENLLKQMGLRATKRIQKGVRKYIKTTQQLADQIGSSKRMYQRIKQVASINADARDLLKKHDSISNNLQLLIQIQQLKDPQLQVAVSKRIVLLQDAIAKDSVSNILDDIKRVERLQRRNGIEQIEGSRQDDDFYPTHPSITKLLIDREQFSGRIWECACGDGAMSNALESAGYDVLSTDLIDRSYGISGIDFLDKASIKKFGMVDNVVTNPPLKLALPFILQAKKVAKKKIAMLGTTTFLDGVERYKKLWTDKDFPLKIVYQISGRVAFSKNRIVDQKEGGLLSWSWYVWDRDYKGNRPQLDWILPDKCN